MVLWNTLSDVLESSGWIAALIEAEVASSGTAAYFLKVTPLIRIRHAHQITLMALKKLQHEAFLQLPGNESEEKWVPTSSDKFFNKTSVVLLTPFLKFFITCTVCVSQVYVFSGEPLLCDGLSSLPRHRI